MAAVNLAQHCAGSKADLMATTSNVRFVPMADIATLLLAEPVHDYEISVRRTDCETKTATALTSSLTLEFLLSDASSRCHAQEKV